MEPILSVENLTRIYGHGCPECRIALEDGLTNICPGCESVAGCMDVSFDLYHGEVLGIVGESGSGKSTLLRLLYFDEPASSGVMRINLDQSRDRIPSSLTGILTGLDNVLALNSFHKRTLRNQLMGMVYQSPHLGLKMGISSGGNIGERLLMANCRSIARIRAKASELLEKTEVPVSRMDEPPGNFSGGMQQRVQIARALSVNPSLLFLDEPTTGLDLSVQARVLDLIKNLQQEMNLTTVVVSHDLGIIKHLTTRTMVMKNGRVVESGLTDQILEDPQHEFTQLLVNSTL
ncbi:MAG: ATP-binding cassette domain-containing protein [Desulfonatronovibrio sp.]